MGQKVSPSAPSASLSWPSAPLLPERLPLGTAVGVPVDPQQHAARPSTSAASTSAAHVAQRAPQSVGITQLGASNEEAGKSGQNNLQQILNGTIARFNQVQDQNFHKHFIAKFSDKHDWLESIALFSKVNSFVRTLIGWAFKNNPPISLQQEFRCMRKLEGKERRILLKDCGSYYNVEINDLILSKDFSAKQFLMQAARFKPRYLSGLEGGSHLYVNIRPGATAATLKNGVYDFQCESFVAEIIANSDYRIKSIQRGTGYVAVSQDQSNRGSCYLKVTYASLIEYGEVSELGSLYEGTRRYVEFMAVDGIYYESVGGSIYDKSFRELLESNISTIKEENLKEGKHVSQVVTVYGKFNENDKGTKPKEKITTEYGYLQSSNVCDKQTITTITYGEAGEELGSKTTEYKKQNEKWVAVQGDGIGNSPIQSEAEDTSQSASGSLRNGANIPAGYIPIAFVPAMLRALLAEQHLRSGRAERTLTDTGTRVDANINPQPSPPIANLIDL